jgi:hypothetical protein
VVKRSDLNANHYNSRRPPEGLGFWACRTVIWFITLAFVLSAIIACASLIAVVDGSMQVSAADAGSAKGMSIILALPFGLAYVLRQIYKRRKRVLELNTSQA